MLDPVNDVHHLLICKFQGSHGRFKQFWTSIFVENPLTSPGSRSWFLQVIFSGEYSVGMVRGFSRSIWYGLISTHTSFPLMEDFSIICRGLRWSLQIEDHGPANGRVPVKK